jgi:ribonuclease R
VAEFIGKQKKTFIYRIHDEPNEDKLLQCRQFRNLDNIDFTQGSVSQALNKLMSDVNGTKDKILLIL